MLGVEDAYRRLAAQYDEVVNRTRDLDALVLREHGPSVAGKVLLELGCGTGKNTIWLADGSLEVIAIDLSEAMLGRARARVTAPHVRFLNHDLRIRWPLADESVDLIVGNLVLEHVQDLTFVFGEMKRVLRRGGEVFNAEFHPFRQLLGRGVEISGVHDGAVEAYRHDVSEYVNAGLDQSFSLLRIGEWRDERDLAEEAPPRLLTLHFIRSSATPDDA
jgi:ubiquinone/menaquinone biosynthesis C-methylase UbiE